jgi:type IV secretion system protein VirD4
MTPTKLLIGQIIVVFTIVLASVWFSTQWAAAALAYQPELGRPWFVAFGWPIYAPWALFLWWFSFEAYAPVIFEKAGDGRRERTDRLRRRNFRLGVARAATE